MDDSEATMDDTEALNCLRAVLEGCDHEVRVFVCISACMHCAVPPAPPPPLRCVSAVRVPWGRPAKNGVPGLHAYVYIGPAQGLAENRAATPRGAAGRSLLLRELLPRHTGGPSAPDRARRRRRCVGVHVRPQSRLLRSSTSSSCERVCCGVHSRAG